MRKTAVLSMDVEDWYHLDYFDKGKCDRTVSMLDGLEAYARILAEYQIKSSFFVVGELVDSLGSSLADLQSVGHELGVHSHNHIRPLLQTPEVFRADIRSAIQTLRQVTGERTLGYRAPCFSLDRERLDIIREEGFVFDSSKINFSSHPLYGDLNVSGFQSQESGIYFQDSFFEFEVSTLHFLGRNIPVSGGGYLRIFPWSLMRKFLEVYLRYQQFYVLYIHPFELSQVKNPIFPQDTSLLTRARFSAGRKGVGDKLRRLIDLLLAKNFEVVTFGKLRESLLTKSS
ncbi:MAG: polysaccharide deacetylase family protein [Imperialibacter sp.]